MPGTDRSWSATLHRLWSSVAAITAREELAELVLPPLRTLPGVVAVWGLRHDPGGGFSAYRWSGLPLEGDHRKMAEGLAAAGRPGETRVLSTAMPGYTRVIGAGFEVPGEHAGSILLAVDDRADVPFLTACLSQVVDATREAVHRLGARRADEEQQVRDALLAEASLQMDAVLDTTQTMQRVARMAVPAIADGCLVYVAEDDKPVLRSAVHVDMRRLSGFMKDPDAVGFLITLAGEAMTGTATPRVPAEVDAMAGTRTADARVLRARGRVIGVLIFLFDRGDDQIPPALFLRDLAYRAALAIDNGELYEQRRREVVALQQHLLPRRLPAAGALEIAASYTVGDQVMEVGGDFYDVVVRDDDVVAALIGDVCGRGVEAAALTGMARHTLGTLLQEGVSPARALGRLNTGLRRDGSWRFVTAGVALLRPAGDGIGVQWMSSGHPAPIVLRRGRPAEPGRGGGVPLGILPQPSIGRSRLWLAPGDTLLMLTDGLTEGRDAAGDMFEQDALWESLERLRDVPTETLVHELSRASAAFGGAGADDIAVLAIRAKEHDGD